MSFPSFAIVAVLAVLGLIWLVRSERRKAAERAQLIGAMGFQPLAQPDPQVTETLLALYRRGQIAHRRLKLSKVSHRESAAGHVYIFDVLDPNSRRNHLVASSAVGLIRPGAGLPRFEVCAYSEEGGRFGSMMVHVIGEKLGHGRVVRFDDLPEFSGRFTALSPDDGGEGAVRGYLTSRVRQELLGCQFLILAAGGDAFALQPNPFPEGPGMRRPPESGTPYLAKKPAFIRTVPLNESDLLRKLVDEAIRLAPVLEPGATSSASVPGRG